MKYTAIKTLFVCALIFGLLAGLEAANSESKPTSETDIIKDSNLSFNSAMSGSNAPAEIRKNLVRVQVEYYSFDGKLHSGQLLVHKSLKKDVAEIFKLIKTKKFPIAKVIPITEYTWSDDSSMADNNTSAFNYRFIAGTKKLSNHATGRAIDINPLQNPAVYADGTISPKGAKYDKKVPGTLTADCFIVKEFKKRGWRWGGEFQSFKDWQHFDKE